MELFQGNGVIYPGWSQVWSFIKKIFNRKILFAKGAGPGGKSGLLATAMIDLFLRGWLRRTIWIICKNLFSLQKGGSGWSSWSLAIIFEKASVPSARGHIRGQFGSCPKRNFRSIWINVKVMQKGSSDGQSKPFVKGKMSNGAILFAKRISMRNHSLCKRIEKISFVKRQLYSSYCRNRIININVGSTEFKCYFRKRIQWQIRPWFSQSGIKNEGIYKSRHLKLREV